MFNEVQTDIVILGGGIAGLWLLNRLRQRGFSVILLEANTLGGEQTNKSQGIIHGGMKYALQGKMTPAAAELADMPALWQACLDGIGEIDLTHVPILSKCQYLWSTGKLASKLTGFFASLALQGNVSTLAPADYPKIFHHKSFKGAVYALDEMVLDVPSLVAELARPHQDIIFKVSTAQQKLVFDEKTQSHYLEISGSQAQKIKIKAKRFIFTAGAGNEMALQPLMSSTKMQRRPLHMVLVKNNFGTPLYGHCLGMRAVPRMTITTHPTMDGQQAWYLGGQIAEEGVRFTQEKQIQIAKKELKQLFPWLDFSKMAFASFMVDRAEASQEDGKKPDGVTISQERNCLIAWPTKLAFAPKLAEKIIQVISNEKLMPGLADISALSSFPKPHVAKPIWDELLC